MRSAIVRSLEYPFHGLGELHREPAQAEIAQRMHLAAGTVRNYVSTILQKLGVADRTQAAVVALQRGVISNSDLQTGISSGRT